MACTLKTRTLCLCWVALTCFSLCAQQNSSGPAAEFDFRGIRPGMTLDEAGTQVQKKFPSAALNKCGKYSEWDCLDWARGVKVCTVDSECGEDVAWRRQSIDLYFVDGKLSSISYDFRRESTVGSPFDDYSGMRRALVNKYGRPTKTSAEVQSKTGTHYDGEVLLWENAVSEVVLIERCMKYQKLSCLRLSDKELYREQLKRMWLRK